MKRGYITLALDCKGIHWPATEQIFTFRGHEILVRPENDQDSPSVSIAFDEKLPVIEARKVMNEFLSCYSWKFDGAVYEKWSVCNTAGPMRVGKGPYGAIYDAPIGILPATQKKMQKLLWRFGAKDRLQIQYSISFLDITKLSICSVAAEENKSNGLTNILVASKTSRLRLVLMN